MAGQQPPNPPPTAPNGGQPPTAPGGAAAVAGLQPGASAVSWNNNFASLIAGLKTKEHVHSFINQIENIRMPPDQLARLKNYILTQAPAAATAGLATPAANQAPAQVGSVAPPPVAGPSVPPVAPAASATASAAAAAPARVQPPAPAQTTPRPTSAVLGTTIAPGNAATVASQSIYDPAEPVVWPSAQQGRPTLTGGIASGRMAGTPAFVARLPDDPAMLAADDTRTRRKNTPGEQSMRRSIQDLVASIDPNVKVEPEVEDLLLEIADEFIDSVTNFGCRLAAHRGADTLEVKDLQLHLERNHNIRIPGFASDDARFAPSQTAAPAPSVATGAAAAPARKGGPNTGMTLRSHRLQQVQAAKRDGKLL